jgi:hypothetical protein
MGFVPAARARVGARLRRSGLGLVVARRRRRAARLLRRGRQVRGGAASGYRRRTRRRIRSPGSDLRRGHVRRLRPHARRHRDDHDRRRVQGLAHAPRRLARRAWRPRHGGRGGRGCGPLGGGRARGAVCPPGDQARLRRRQLRRSSELASAAGSPQPSAGTRGAARASTTARTRRAAGRCQPARGGLGHACGRAGGGCAAIGRGACAGSGAGGGRFVASAGRLAGSHGRRARRRRNACHAIGRTHPAWTPRAERSRDGAGGGTA